MSTALGHGLVGPKRRGKPVSSANEGRRVRWLDGGDRAGVSALLLCPASLFPSPSRGAAEGETGGGRASPARPSWVLFGSNENLKNFLGIRRTPYRKGIRSIFRNWTGGRRVAGSAPPPREKRRGETFKGTELDPDSVPSIEPPNTPALVSGANRFPPSLRTD